MKMDKISTTANCWCTNNKSLESTRGKSSVSGVMTAF